MVNEYFTDWHPRSPSTWGDHARAEPFCIYVIHVKKVPVAGSMVVVTIQVTRSPTRSEKVAGGAFLRCRPAYEHGRSFISADGATWQDLSPDCQGAVVCLKAFAEKVGSGNAP